MITRRLIARIARQGGGKLLDKAVNRLFPDSPAEPAAPQAPAEPPRKPTLTGKAANIALASLARRSVPAAIVIGGGILAKRLYDNRRARKKGGGDAES